MNRSFLICRLRWPLFLLLVGVLALLHQMGITRFWGFFWPLALIFWGVMLLLERAAVREEDLPPYPGQYSGAYPNPYPGQYPGAYAGPAPVANPVASPAPAASETSIVPVHGDEITPPTRGGGQL